MKSIVLLFLTLINTNIIAKAETPESSLSGFPLCRSWLELDTRSRYLYIQVGKTNPFYKLEEDNLSLYVDTYTPYSIRQYSYPNLVHAVSGTMHTINTSLDGQDTLKLETDLKQEDQWNPGTLSYLVDGYSKSVECILKK